MMLALLNGLVNRVDDPDYILHATRLAAVLSGLALDAPRKRAFSVNAIQEMAFGSNGDVRFVANGVVRIQADIDRESQTIALILNIKDGWHVNAHIPLEEYLIPTGLTIGGIALDFAAYPEPRITTLAFNENPLALYENEIRLTGNIPPPSGQLVQAVLTLQACSDKICLAPIAVSFNLW